MEYKNSNLQFMYLNITNNCNLKCRYCYDENSKNIDNSIGQSIDTYKQLAEDCSLLGLESVAITGGEPLVNKNWFNIAKLFFDKDIIIRISTNGTLLNEESIKKFKELNAIVQISLDGNENTMEFVTQVSGTYGKIMKSIELLKKYNITFNLNAVLGKHNLDSVDFLNKLSKENDVKLRFNFYKDVYNDGKGLIQALNICEFDEVLSKLNLMKKTNPNILLCVPPLLTPENFELKFNPSCGWPKNVVGVLANGDVTLCALASCMPELVAGNIKKDRFYNIWKNSKFFTKLRQFETKDLKGICKECPVNDLCVGACRLEAYKATGDHCAPNRTCQIYYEALLDGTLNKKHFPSKMLEIL